MAYVIGDNCVNCGTCADACPLGIISEGDGKYVIDADQCVECGTCAAECPNDAITQEYDQKTKDLCCNAQVLRFVFWGCDFLPGIV